MDPASDFRKLYFIHKGGQAIETPMVHSPA